RACRTAIRRITAGRFVTRRLRGDAEPEGAAPPFLAFDADPALVLLDDVAADREAEAGAALLPVIGSIHLPEALEDLVAELRRDAAPLVLDAHFDPAVLLNARDSYLAAAGRKLDGIREQVDQHLHQPVAVGQHGDFSRKDIDPDLLLIGEGLHRFTGAFEHGRERLRHRVHLHLPALEPFEIQNVIDQRDQAHRVA